MMHAGTDADPQQRRATGAPERVRNSQESGKLFLTVCGVNVFAGTHVWA